MAPAKALEILWIVLFRFRLWPRLWAIALIAVNVGALAFLDTIYGWMALVSALIGILVMIVIYFRLGFVRLLGIGHVLWLPMLAWFATNLPDPGQTPWLHAWVLVLIVFNGLSLVIDTSDVIRYLRGERAPHYTWQRSA